MTNPTGALTYINTIKNRGQRAYALGLYNYYRTHGTDRAMGWPHNHEAALPASTSTRIANAIRHYMVGDCNIKGTRVA